MLAGPEFLEEMLEWKKYCFEAFDEGCYDDAFNKMGGNIFDVMVECLRNTEYKDGISVFDEILKRFNREA